MLNLNTESAPVVPESRLTGIPIVDGEEMGTSGLASASAIDKSRTATMIGGEPGRKVYDPSKPIDYKNGRKIEQLMYSYDTYFKHKEKIPKHYYPLVQYLENVEVKYHNDNLFEDTPIGFPTRAQLLRERSFHLPIVKDTPIQKARYQRKLEETKNNIVSARKKYDFKTYDQYSSHYFLTGARFNRKDTVDSKILNKYGIFIHRKNPELVYIKSSQKALESLTKDREEMKNFKLNDPLYKSKSVQVDMNEIKKTLRNQLPSNEDRSNY